MNNTDIIALIDLTRLVENDSLQSIIELCHKATTPFGPVAAVCVYPEFVATAKNTLRDTPIAVATVVNFPSGNESLTITEQKIKESLAAGADEIDIVMPYQQLQLGDLNYVTKYLLKCRELTRKHCLKIIIESGALSPTQVNEATSIVAKIGADFVKTSTGKIEHGASFAAVETILQVLAALDDAPGIKISGGIRTPQQAHDYLQLITNYMGASWIAPQTVRLGASKLLDELLSSH